ncbi:hypothetical protein WH47_00892, partial [Habropoda laboriosa]
ENYLAEASSYVLHDDCSEFDIGELEDYLSTLNLENVPTIDMMIGGFECPVTALPFGALKSDWARLILLRKAQPKGSIFFEKLGRLFRILAVAYFRMEESFGGTGEGFTSSSTISDERSIEQTAFTSSNVTRENKEDDSDTIANNISSSDVAFSPVGTAFSSTTVQIVEKEADISVFPGVNTTGRKYTAASNNYPDNHAVNEGRLRTNEPEATETEREINNSRGFFYGNSLISTIDDFTKDQRIVANNLTVDELNENKDDPISARSGEFSTVESNVSADLINDIPVITFPAISRDTYGSVTSGYEKSISKSVVDESRLIFTVAEISYVKSITEQSRVYPGEISDNGVASSRESFNQSPSNPRADDVSLPFQRIPWNSLDSTLPRNKIKKPSIRRKNPPEMDFWRYVIIPENVPFVTPVATSTSIPETDQVNRSKKRGSLNTNIEKNFRWFYNFGHEDEQHSSKNPSDPRGIYIRCNGERRNDFEFTKK